MVSQVKRDAQTKDSLLHQYVTLTIERQIKFESFEILHIPREYNPRADVLSKLASTRSFGVNHSFIQNTLRGPSIETPKAMMMIIEDVS